MPLRVPVRRSTPAVHLPGGPTDLWKRVEAARVEWCEHGGPGWERLGLSVDPAGEHTVWPDEPGHTLRVFRS